MPISEGQLETWSHQGAITASQATHESVRNALTAYASPIREKIAAGEVDIYLQGSYKNDTNIRADSDVDVVVQLNSTFQYDLSALPLHEAQAFTSSMSSATYGWIDFRADVLQALRAYFRAEAVKEGHKALKVTGNPGRLPADVIVCLQYRNYRVFRNWYDQSFHEGIILFALPDNRRVINYPKQHYDNGVAKNAASSTGGWYKPTVRVFKNARSYLADHQVIRDDLAPSYCVECLLYNVSNAMFVASRQQTYCNILNWLSAVDLSGFLCQNGITPLFGNSPEQWSTSNARQSVSALVDLWNKS